MNCPACGFAESKVEVPQRSPEQLSVSFLVKIGARRIVRIGIYTEFLKPPVFRGIFRIHVFGIGTSLFITEVLSEDSSAETAGDSTKRTVIRIRTMQPSFFIEFIVLSQTRAACMQYNGSLYYTRNMHGSLLSVRHGDFRIRKTLHFF